MNADIAIPEQDINDVARVKCQKSLLFHTRYFFKKKFNRKFVIGEHHTIICDALERVLRGECTRLIINIAPRYGKTELAVKNFISHGLSLNPGAKFIHLSYSDTLALDNSEEVKDMVTSAEYQALFPEVQIKKDSKAKNKWYTTQNGGVYATSAAGQVTGFGAGKVDDEEDLLSEIETINADKATFGGAIIIDDPIKPDDTDSDNRRERVNNRFDSTIRNRVNSRTTPIIIIMQRLHLRDLSGYLMAVEPDEWEVISLPCIKEDNTALWPFKHTIQELEKLREINQIVFERQYMQNPMPSEGLLFPISELKFYDASEFDPAKDLKHVEYIMGFVDPANKGGDSFAMPLGFVVGGDVYIHEVIFNTKGTDHTIGQTVYVNSKYPTNELLIEGNFGWAQVGQEIRELMASANPECTVLIFKASINKETRILAQASFIKNRFHFRADYATIPEYKNFMYNLTSYSSQGLNDHDDAPDSCAGLAFWLIRNIGHQFK